MFHLKKLLNNFDQWWHQFWILFDFANKEKKNKFLLSELSKWCGYAMWQQNRVSTKKKVILEEAIKMFAPIGGDTCYFFLWYWLHDVKIGMQAFCQRNVHSKLNSCRLCVGLRRSVGIFLANYSQWHQVIFWLILQIGLNGIY